MGTDAWDPESTLEESLLYLGGNGEPLQVFLMGELLLYQMDKPFGGNSSSSVFP